MTWKHCPCAHGRATGPTFSMIIPRFQTLQLCLHNPKTLHSSLSIELEVHVVGRLPSEQFSNSLEPVGVCRYAQAQQPDFVERASFASQTCHSTKPSRFVLEPAPLLFSSDKIPVMINSTNIFQEWRNHVCLF